MKWRQCEIIVIQQIPYRVHVLACVDLSYRGFGHLDDLWNAFLSICFIDIHRRVSSQKQLLLENTHYGELDIVVYNGKQLYSCAIRKCMLFIKRSNSVLCVQMYWYWYTSRLIAIKSTTQHNKNQRKNVNIFVIQSLYCIWMNISCLDCETVIFAKYIVSLVEEKR